MTATATAATPVRCRGCRRLIPSGRTVGGYGRGCAARIRKAAVSARLAGFSPRQRDDAAEMIELGGVIPLIRRPGLAVFLTVGSDGEEVYRTASTGHCNCPAGLLGRRCYHAAAVAMVAA